MSKTIVEARELSLNGGLRTVVGGVSRLEIPVTLPPKTVRWYYSFTTSTGQSGTNILNLGIQVAAMTTDMGVVSSVMASKLKVPPGTGAADVYLLSPNNVQAFLAKWDNQGGNFNYHGKYSVQKGRQAVVEALDLTSGTYHLGIRNPSTLDGVNVRVEVVAIVEEQVYHDEWVTESTLRIRNDCMTIFNTSESGRSEVCDCALNRVTTSITPSAWLKIPMGNRSSLLREHVDRCYSDTDNEMLKLAERNFIKDREERQARVTSARSEVEELNRKAYSAASLSDYESAVSSMISAIDRVESDSELKANTSKTWLSDRYNSVAWWMMLLNDLSGCSSYLQKALALNADNMYAWGNTGLYHLLSGNYRKAEETFLRYKRKKRLPDGKKWADVIAEDFEILTDRGIWHADFDRVRTLLKIKVK